MKLKNLFTSGKMNKDLDERLVPKGEYRDALNVRVANSTGSNVGAIENSLSNVKKSALDFGSGAKCIGAADDDEANRVYWFVKSDVGSYVAEYDSVTDQASFILEDTRSNSVLNFQLSHMIQANVLTDADNEKKFLYFTDGINPPRRINIQTAKSYEQNGFEAEDINVIVKPPLHPPLIELIKDTSDPANRIEESFIRFAYRYKYLDGEYSPLSPFSELAFSPKSYSYTYTSGSNNGMLNNFNKVDVFFETGSKLVTDVEIVFKEDGNNNVYIADTINKNYNSTGEVLPNDSQSSISFKNNKIYKVLPEKQLFRLYDNVPLKAFAQDFIDNRIAYANYVENYDLVTCDQESVVADMTLNYESDENRLETMKSGRDYEVGISYLDDYGRGTTIITSENSNVHIPFQDSPFGNILSLTINHIAPLFSKFFRVFLKQSRGVYDHIIAQDFYQTSEHFYLKIPESDVNKVKKGDFVYIKSDTSGVKTGEIKVKIIDITTEEANFLDLDGSESSASNVVQQPGTYIKISKVLGVRFSEDDYQSYLEPAEVPSYDRSRSNSGVNSNNIINPHVNIASSTEPEIFYGYDSSTDDMTVSTGASTYTTGKNKRFEIEVVDTSGSSDLVRIRSYEQGYVPGDADSSSDYIYETAETAITSTMAIQDNDNDAISVTFGSTTGHNLGDRWVVNMRGYSNSSTNRGCFSFGNQNTDVEFNNHHWDNDHAWIALKCPNNTTDATIGQKIGPNTRIDFYIEEYESGGQFTARTVHTPATVISLYNDSGITYDNLEEFIYEHKDSYQKIVDVIPSNKFHFRRGTKVVVEHNTGPSPHDSEAVRIEENITFSTNPTHDLFLFIQSKGFTRDAELRFQNRYVRMYARLKSTVKQEGDSKIILETESLKIDDDIFYEIPGTYVVNPCGYHKGKDGDITQTADTAAVIRLNTFNAIAWGDGVESQKIRDTFGGQSISIQTKPLIAIQDYRENHRVASITYSDVYEQSTNYNGLNEFNLSQINYKDVDDEYGDIRRIHSRDTDLVVFQENKVSKLLVNKSVLFNADGTGNVAQNVNVLGQQVPFVGEYGISYNAHSFASWGNRMYFVDDRRSAVMRLSQDGLTEISQYGMRDWFKDEIKAKDFKNIIGGYDPYAGQYVTSIKNPLVAWLPEEYLCPRCFCGMDGYIYATAALPTTTTTTLAGTTTTTTLGSGEVGPNCVSMIFEIVSGEVDIQVNQCQPTGASVKSPIYKLNKSTLPAISISCMEYESGQTVSDFIVSGTGEALMRQGGACGADTCGQSYNMYYLLGSTYGTQWLVWDCVEGIYREVFNVPAGNYVVVNTIYPPEAVNDPYAQKFTQYDLMFGNQQDPLRDLQDATNQILG